MSLLAGRSTSNMMHEWSVLAPTTELRPVAINSDQWQSIAVDGNHLRGRRGSKPRGRGCRRRRSPQQASLARMPAARRAPAFRWSLIRCHTDGPRAIGWSSMSSVAQRHSDGTRMALGWHSGGTRMALGWHSDGARMVLGWHSDGTRMALGWHSDSTRVALGWHSDGTRMALVWRSYGTRQPPGALRSRLAPWKR